MKTYDLIIIGGGPAGLSSAIFAHRLGLETIVLEKNITGGQPAIAACIENYPGIEKIDGWTLTRVMEKQVKDLGVAIFESQEATKIGTETGYFTVITRGGAEYLGRAIVIATGGEPAELQVKGEKRLARKGVHYCAQCAGPAYRDGKVAVCGNGYQALIAAAHLLNLAERVFFITEDSRLYGDAVLSRKLSTENRLHQIHRTIIQRILGDTQVEAIETKSLESGDVRQLKVDAVFVHMGINPRTDIIHAEKDQKGFLRVDLNMQTSIPGIFAVGNAVRADCRIVIAAGEGARAAFSVAASIERKK